MQDDREIRRAPLPRMPLRVALSRVIAISAVTVVLVFGGLSLQMALGSDPALGPKAVKSSTTAAPAVTQTPSTAPPATGDGGSRDTPPPSILMPQAAPQAAAPAAQSAPSQTPAAPTPDPVQTSTS